MGPSPIGGEHGALGGFLGWNRRVCNEVLRPRLYAITHRSALDILTARSVAAHFPDKSGALLEFGCGRTFRFCRLIGSHFVVLCGTDIEDIAARDWPDRTEFKKCEPEHIPWPDASFDAVVINSVIEHVENPRTVFAELARVMKPGATLFMNLPNRWDYVSVAARALGRLKGKVLAKIVGMDYDEFPVHYRCNTRRDLDSAVAGTGLFVETFRVVPSEPAYLSFLVPLYVMGAIYQLFISVCCLDLLQPAFFVVLRKAEEDLAPHA